MRVVGRGAKGSVAGRARAFALAVMVVGAGMARAPRAAAAQPTAAELKEARDAFARAEKDEKAGDWNGALEKLRRVAQVKVTPGVRFHLALAEEKTGQLVTALTDYALAEKQATDEKNREVLAALKTPMADLQARVPRLVVKVPPDVRNLEVTLDGKTLTPGFFSAEMPVDPQAHTIEAKAPGKRTFAKTVTAREREVASVEVTMEDDPRAAAPPIAGDPRGSMTTVQPPEGAATSGDATAGAGGQTSPAPLKTAGGSKTGAIVTTTFAVVLVGAGVGAFLIAGGKQSDGQDACKTIRQSSGCEDLRSPVRTWDTIALASWIGGGALATVAVILWARPSSGGTSAASAGGRVFIGPGTAGFAGSF